MKRKVGIGTLLIMCAIGTLASGSKTSAAYPPGLVRLPAKIWETPRAKVSALILTVSRVEMIMPV